MAIIVVLDITFEAAVLGRVVFTDSSRRRRTVMNFRFWRQAEHHTGGALFGGISIIMIERFPSDYMPMLCLGTTKRMLLIWRWFGAPRGRLFSRQGLQRLNGDMQKIRPLMSCKFPWVFRAIDDLDY